MLEFYDLLMSHSEAFRSPSHYSPTFHILACPATANSNALKYFWISIRIVRLGKHLFNMLFSHLYNDDQNALIIANDKSVIMRLDVFSSFICTYDGLLPRGRIRR